MGASPEKFQEMKASAPAPRMAAAPVAYVSQPEPPLRNPGPSRYIERRRMQEISDFEAREMNNILSQERGRSSSVPPQPAPTVDYGRRGSRRYR